MAVSEENQKVVEQASSELRFALDREGIDMNLQVEIYRAGILNVRHFAYMVSSMDELKKVLKDDFNIDASDGLAKRVLVAKMVSAWESARARAGKMAEAEGEADVRNVPKTLPMGDLISMREVFEAKWWELEDSSVPARSYVEKKLDQVEKKDMRAERLSEVLSMENDDTEHLDTIMDKSGCFNVVKASISLPLPKDSEELRERITLMGTMWMFISLKNSQCTYLKGLTPQLWVDYQNYLLGEHVSKLTAKDEHGQVIASAVPRWGQVLQYEHAIRAAAMRRVARGETLDVALRAAMKDPVIKERNFTTPLGIQKTGIKRPYDHDDRSQQHSRNQDNHGKKGKGKGYRAALLEGCAATSPDGKPICFSWNNPSMKCPHGRKCRYQHICGKCFKPDKDGRHHPFHQCRAEKDGGAEGAPPRRI